MFAKGNILLDVPSQREIATLAVSALTTAVLTHQGTSLP